MVAQPVSDRLHIICTAAALGVVNDTLRAIDPTSTGDPITMPLRQAGTTDTNGTAYGTSWAMEDVTSKNLKAAIRDADWKPKPSTPELLVRGPGDPVPAWGTQRLWIWDGDLLPFGECLTALGLDYAYEPPRS